eukprot:CFRG0006T1
MTNCSVCTRLCVSTLLRRRPAHNVLNRCASGKRLYSNSTDGYDGARANRNGKLWLRLNTGVKLKPDKAPSPVDGTHSTHAPNKEKQPQEQQNGETKLIHEGVSKKGNGKLWLSFRKLDVKPSTHTPSRSVDATPSTLTTFRSVNSTPSTHTTCRSVDVTPSTLTTCRSVDATPSTHTTSHSVNATPHTSSRSVDSTSSTPAFNETESETRVKVEREKNMSDHISNYNEGPVLSIEEKACEEIDGIVNTLHTIQTISKSTDSSHFKKLTGDRDVLYSTPGFRQWMNERVHSAEELTVGKSRSDGDVHTKSTVVNRANITLSSPLSPDWKNAHYDVLRAVDSTPAPTEVCETIYTLPNHQKGVERKHGDELLIDHSSSKQEDAGGEQIFNPKHISVKKATELSVKVDPEKVTEETRSLVGQNYRSASTIQKCRPKKSDADDELLTTSYTSKQRDCSPCVDSFNSKKDTYTGNGDDELFTIHHSAKRKDSSHNVDSSPTHRSAEAGSRKDTNSAGDPMSRTSPFANMGTRELSLLTRAEVEENLQPYRIAREQNMKLRDRLLMMKADVKTQEWYNKHDQTVAMIRHPCTPNQFQHQVPISLELRTTMNPSMYANAVIKLWKGGHIGTLSPSDLVHACICLNSGLVRTPRYSNNRSKNDYRKYDDIWVSLIKRTIHLENQLNLYQLAAVIVCASTNGHSSDRLLQMCAIRVNRAATRHANNYDNELGISRALTNLQRIMKGEHVDPMSPQKCDTGSRHKNGNVSANINDSSMGMESVDVDKLDRDTTLLVMSAFSRSGLRYQPRYITVLRTLGNRLSQFVRAGVQEAEENEKEAKSRCCHSKVNKVESAQGRKQARGGTSNGSLGFTEQHVKSGDGESISSIVDLCAVMQMHGVLRIVHEPLFEAIGHLIDVSLFDRTSKPRARYQEVVGDRLAIMSYRGMKQISDKSRTNLGSVVAVGGIENSHMKSFPQHPYSLNYLATLLHSMALLNSHQPAISRTLQDVVSPVVSHYLYTKGLPELRSDYSPKYSQYYTPKSRYYPFYQTSTHACSDASTQSSMQWLYPVTSALHSLAILSIPKAIPHTMHDHYSGETRLSYINKKHKYPDAGRHVDQWRNLLSSVLVDAAPYLAKIPVSSCPRPQQFRIHTFFSVLARISPEVHSHLLNTIPQLIHMLHRFRLNIVKGHYPTHHGLFHMSVTAQVNAAIDELISEGAFRSCSGDIFDKEGTATDETTKGYDVDNDPILGNSPNCTEEKERLRVVHEHVDQSSGFSVDIAIPALKIGFEVDGPTAHYVNAGADSRTQIGTTIAKHFLLREAGWKLMVIDQYVWDKRWWSIDEKDYIDDRRYTRQKTNLRERIRDVVLSCIK